MNDQILDFVIKKREARYKDLINYFVEGKICSEKTLIGHKRELEALGRLKKRISTGQLEAENKNRPVYYVPGSVEQKIEEEKFVKIYGEIESYVPSKEFEKMKARLERARQDRWKTKRMQKQLEIAELALSLAEDGAAVDAEKALRDKEEAEKWLLRDILEKEEE